MGNQTSFKFYNGFYAYIIISGPKISIYKPFKVILPVLCNIIDITANYDYFESIGLLIWFGPIGLGLSLNIDIERR